MAALRFLALLLAIALAPIVACSSKKDTKHAKAHPRPTGSVSASRSWIRIDPDTPLVIDWKPESQASLERAMRQGIAILRYDEKDLFLLPGCKAGGSYSFEVMRGERTMQLATTQEIKIALPTLGASIASRIENDLARGTTIDIAMLLTGRMTSSRSSVRRADLHGECARATHFARRVLIGGYVLRTGTKNHPLSASQIMTGTELGAAFLQGVGSIVSCRVPIDRAAPPADCHAALELEVEWLED